MWTRIALYATLGYALDALGHSWDTWGFWVILGLFWAVEHLARMEVIEQLQAELERMRAQAKKDTSNEQH
jgi:hypothetical protein